MTSVEQKVKVDFLEDVKPQDVENGEILVGASGDIQRLPVPSNDPNDPLNYNTLEKAGIIVSCCWFCMHSFLSVISLNTFRPR